MYDTGIKFRVYHLFYKAAPKCQRAARAHATTHNHNTPRAYTPSHLIPLSNIRMSVYTLGSEKGNYGEGITCGIRGGRFGERRGECHATLYGSAPKRMPT